MPGTWAIRLRLLPRPGRMTAMSDDATDTMTVLDRLLAAGLSLERAEDHLRSGRVEVDGVLVTDPYRPAPPPARLVLVAG